ncbi:ABC transporter ATP-binding protein [Perkinsela sp. CCAP 1560/4]|nr:ABC transporter ATP-binding protein [Perkinsela sp. CCAP 1560/4]|eukprot:KNH00557.1 ABC transporter ATP-binding protein [Perkinsela sp. CCAP 1560/4]
MQLVNFLLREIIRKLEEEVHASKTDADKQSSGVLTRASHITEISEQLFCLLQNKSTMSEVFSSLQKYAETSLGEVLHSLWVRNLHEEGKPQYKLHEEVDEYMFLHSFFGMLSCQHDWSQGTIPCKSELFRSFCRNYHIVFEGVVPYFAQSLTSNSPRKAFYSLVPCFQKHVHELPTKEFVVINDEISYFYQLEKSLHSGDMYSVDKIRIIGSQLSGSTLQAAEYRLLGSAEKIQKQQPNSEEQSQILASTRAILGNLMRSCAVETWQSSQLRQLRASLKAHALPLHVLHDPLPLLVIMHNAFSAWEAGKRESVEHSLLIDVILDMMADEKRMEIFLYGLFYWFHTFDREKLYTNKNLTPEQEDITVLHPMDRSARVILLSSPFIACCRIHHRLFSYLGSVIEDWGDEFLEENTITEESCQSPSQKVILRLKSNVLDIAKLAQNPCLQCDVVRFFTKAINHGIQCLKKCPSLHASLTVNLAFSALLGLIVHSKPHGRHIVAIEYVRLIDVVVTLCGMKSVTTEFPFLRPPNSSIAVWLYEMSLYLRFLHSSPHARAVFQHWFDALGEALPV